MKQVVLSVLIVTLIVPNIVNADEKCSVSCVIAGFAAKNHRSLAAHISPADGACHVGTKSGFPMPDLKCTPGAINPTITVAVLKNPNFRTCCIRDKVESEQDKHTAYKWYGISAPDQNEGENQTCELDHLVPLELGGGDSMDNIWPQCGPDSVTLNERYFKQKDQVEFYLADQVKAGSMDLQSAQRAIAADYTQFLKAASAYCKSHKCE
jgi:hypothetical protein